MQSFKINLLVLLAVAAAPILGGPCKSRLPACLSVGQPHQANVNISYTNPHNILDELSRKPSAASLNFSRCEGIPELDNQLSSNPYSQAICPWSYECDYDYCRVPHTIFHAKCSDDIYQYRNIKNLRRGGQCQCKTLYRPIPVLKFVSCHPNTYQQEWQTETQYVAVGCVCQSSQN